MAQEPPLSALAHGLRTLATKLQQPSASEEEKQTLIHQTLEAVEEQQKKDEEQKSRDLLNEALSTLQGLEQQSGRGQQKDSEAGDGSSKSNLSQEGKAGRETKPGKRRR